MSATAVQYYGIEDVLEAYTNKQTPAFAVWCGKNMLMYYDGDESTPDMQEGEQLLRQFLQGLWQLSTATYTLKTYNDLPAGKIKPSTEYDTAFNFKICPQPVSNFTTMAGVYPQANNPILNELKAIREEIDELRSADTQVEESDEPQTIQEAVIGLIQQPERLSQIVEPLRELVSLGRVLMGMEPLQQQPMQPMQNTMGNVKKIGNTDTTERVYDPAVVARLQNAVNILEQHDDQLVDHLEKLSKVAVNDPAKFKALLTMLDML